MGSALDGRLSRDGPRVERLHVYGFIGCIHVRLEGDSRRTTADTEELVPNNAPFLLSTLFSQSYKMPTNLVHSLPPCTNLQKLSLVLYITIRGDSPDGAACPSGGRAPVSGLFKTLDSARPDDPIRKRFRRRRRR